MAHNVPLLLRLLASSVTAANRAGKIIRDVMSRGDLGIVNKGINDPQTEADRSAQRCIIASLSQQFPDLCIVGEEGPSSSCEVPSDWISVEYDKEIIEKPCPPAFVDVTNDDIVVWVDPLDGTSEYTKGLLEHVTVLVGLAVNGRPVGGVIHQPYYDYKSGNMYGRTIWGLIGLGIGGLEAQNPPADKLIIVTTRSHLDETVQSALDAMNADEILKVGGAGYKVLMLIEGKAHAYVFASKGCKKWDTCAPEGILLARGGKLTDMHGSFYSYTKDVTYPNIGGVLATAPDVDHDFLLTKIPQEIKDKLK